jgi:hypothetical protein
MEFGRAFTYATQDPDWLKKVGIAAVILIIPILGAIVVLGWGLEITRRVINNDPVPLPDWSNFTDHLILGLKGFVVGLVFGLPAGLVNGCQGTINALITNPDLLRNMDPDTVGMIASAGGFLALCCGCLGVLLGLATTFILPAAYGNMMAHNGELGAGFRFGEVFGLVRAAIGPYLLTLVGAILVGIIVPLGLIACIIGVLFTAAWGTTIMSHLYGQAYNAAKAAQNVVASAV